MRHLGVFAKYWEPGAVKTRLARDIGGNAAARLYHEFVSQTLVRFGPLADQCSVWIWPPGRELNFSELAGADWTIRQQISGNLGQRMGHFFRNALGQADRAILIGTDSPSLPSHFVQRAWSILDDAEVVLGPATDGGYYLVGMNTDATDMFEEIPWSTPSVWPSTIRRLEAAGRSWQALDPWYDVDTLNDLIRLRDELAAQDSAGADEQRLLAGIQEALGRNPAAAPRHNRAHGK